MSEEVDDLLSMLDEKPQELTKAVVEGDEDQATFDAMKVVERHIDIADEILISYRQDRTQTQDAINLIRGMIDNVLNAGAPVPVGFIEHYVGAIKAKADTSATAAKVLDAQAKLLAATKASVNINNTNNTQLNVSDNLIDMLSIPINPEDA